MIPKLHFLIVDDLPSMRGIIVRTLRELDYTKFSEAEDGKKALQLLRSTGLQAPIDFVITDWDMPNTNGLSLIKTIRSDKKFNHLPVLIIAAEAKKENIIAAMNAGADGFIVKPFAAVTLDTKIDAILVKREPLLSEKQPNSETQHMASYSP
ncbi:response regulator [Sapientia aquatica]|uniref:Response regulator n=1 Tax=Sapientia aquatica TaxID=1549640 RepID=A0A4R5VYF9_9BURK|nr:response regulator [Sapientia aquatica]TDK64406.1 response regulator [Sapientia aquatica]